MKTWGPYFAVGIALIAILGWVTYDLLAANERAQFEGDVRAAVDIIEDVMTNALWDRPEYNRT